MLQILGRLKQFLTHNIAGECYSSFAYINSGPVNLNTGATLYP